ncbi:MAG TPA: mandelate racemase/muconate lactonizing enzyme family protein [Pseudonocardia sp.]|jgi:L-alanine-DL-glutamate epimerase-like enolase superfamily enzyme|uniref:mandelate racemase/muconate lactonizing enzyme family protein n=1 Tax=Pseudonocardia sp. TaxID=60912 RepID=UPI002B4ADC60|nr:mandelate racemase/muconate lactonizing enzyme family protein [Pseudonocardia sp.]HLU55270.1 mandelate racemase/muconate lactonizing enzyme family protein [Pseudonocardia sp.]
MKITGCATAAVRVTYEGIITGTHVVLRLRTDEGVEGVSYVRANRITARPLALLVEGMVDELAGRDPTRTGEVYDELFREVRGAPVSGLERRAASAIEVACWDLAGKALGRPVRDLMGGWRDRVPVSANWGLMPGGPPDDLAGHVERLLARGFRALKCPVGGAPLDTAIAHVRAVRRYAGPDVRIIVDGNFRWTPKQALRFARATEELDLFWIEDPVAHHDLAGLRRVSESIAQDTCSGEAAQHPDEFRRLLEGGCSDIVMIDQDLGLTGFLTVAHLAACHGRQVVNHLAPEVLGQAVAAVPNGKIVGLVPWGQPLFTEPARIEDGDLVLPDGPGLGLTLDEDVLRTCAL